MGKGGACCHRDKLSLPVFYWRIIGNVIDSCHFVSSRAFCFSSIGGLCNFWKSNTVGAVTERIIYVVLFFLFFKGKLYGFLTDYSYALGDHPSTCEGKLGLNGLLPHGLVVTTCPILIFPFDLSQ